MEISDTASQLFVTSAAIPAEEDYEALRLGLNSYNQIYTDEPLREKLACFLKDESGTILGGILGELRWGWLHIQGLWVAEPLRGKGWGSRLMHQLEHSTRKKDINNFRLETTTFQALGFYRKLGYEVFGQLPDMPPGHTSFFLKKQMATFNAQNQ